MTTCILKYTHYRKYIYSCRFASNSMWQTHLKSMWK